MNRYNSKDRKGVTAVQSIVQNELDWIFREQPISDVGIDAMIEVNDNGMPLAQFIGAQIKSGKGNFTKTQNSYRYYASNIHYNYWVKANVPVILIAYIFETSKAYWIHLCPNNFTKTNKKWKVDIPLKQVLCKKSENRLLSIIEHHNKFDASNNNEDLLLVDLISKASSFASGASFLINSVHEIKQFRIYSEKYLVEIEPFLVNIYFYDNKKVNRINKSLSVRVNNLASSLESDINNFSSHFSDGIIVVENLAIILKAKNQIDLIDKLKAAISNYLSESDKVLLNVKSVSDLANKIHSNDKLLKSSFKNLASVYDLIYSELQIAKNKNELMLSFLNAL